MKKERIVYLDYLRFFAILAVILLHVAAEGWYELNVESLEWNVRNLYNSAVRWGVPVFLMISGSLFLSREIETKKLYSKYILRLVIAYCVWSVFYAAVGTLSDHGGRTGGELAYTFMIKAIGGQFHLWFIPAIIGLYLCVPIFRQIVRKKEIANYYLLLSLAFSFIIPQIVNLSSDFAGGLVGDMVGVVSHALADVETSAVMGYGFYFILGCWLDRVELTKKQRGLVYILGVLGFAATVLLSAAASRRMREPCETYYGAFNLNVLCEAVAVHTWFKYRSHENGKLNGAISKLCECSFGAYLVHVFVLDGLAEMGFGGPIPVLFAVVTVISFGISFVLKQIPVVKKWIV